MQAVLDADCLIAGTLASAGAASRLLDRWREGAFELIACPHLIAEVRGALLDPRISRRYGVTPADVDELCRRIEEESIWRPDPVDPPRYVPNDPGDDYLVAFALENEADVLVTRDRHFEDLSFPGLRIEFPGVFLAALER